MSRRISYGFVQGNKPARLCRHRYCRNLAEPDRTECSKHRQRRFAKHHPFVYHYNLLKQNAKRRDIPFDLTLSEFKKIWQRHPEKWKEKRTWGRETQWQMDRIDPRIGYTFDNIQIITKTKNIRKYYDKDQNFVVDAKWRKKATVGEEAPFLTDN